MGARRLSSVLVSEAKKGEKGGPPVVRIYRTNFLPELDSLRENSSKFRRVKSILEINSEIFSTHSFSKNQAALLF